MTDLDDAAGKLARSATLRAARDAASRALDDALLSDEERAERKAKEEAASKRKWQKRIAIGVVALLLVLGIVGLVINYWQWFLLAGVLGLVALYGRYRWRKRRSEGSRATGEPASTKRSTPERIEPPRARVTAERVSPPSDDTDVEAELAALKARVKR
jgi:hypothetical protein